MQAEIGNPEKVNSVDSLYEAHIRYLNKALFRCILNKKARPVHKIIIDIFNIVAKFSIVLTSRRVAGTLTGWSSRLCTILNFVDIKTKVLTQNSLLILKHNSQFDVSKT